MEHFTGHFFTVQYELDYVVKDMPFIKSLNHLLQHYDVNNNDIPMLADKVKAINTNNQYIIGNGSSHIWIHRNGEYVAGQIGHPQHKRFAIIVTNKVFYS